MSQLSNLQSENRRIRFLNWPRRPSRLSSPSINIFDSGVKDYEGSPVHSITKEDWRLHRRYKEGERGPTYPDGRKFNPFLDIVANIYSPRHVHRHIEGVEVTYYTSGRNGRGLLYLDIDAHQPWQTDETKAKRILQDFFPFGYFRASRRGQNGYLKIRYDTAEQFNDLADHLEATLRQLFLTKGILCDIEIKGKITTKDKSGSLAKSPFTTARCPCHKRDETDDWNDDQLQKFKNCPTVNVRRVEFLVNEIEAQIDEDKAAKVAAHKKSLDERANPERELVTFTLAKLGKSEPDKSSRLSKDSSALYQGFSATRGKITDYGGGSGKVEGDRKIQRTC